MTLAEGYWAASLFLSLQKSYEKVAGELPSPPPAQAESFVQTLMTSTQMGAIGDGTCYPQASCVHTAKEKGWSIEFGAHVQVPALSQTSGITGQITSGLSASPRISHRTVVKLITCSSAKSSDIIVMGTT